MHWRSAAALLLTTATTFRGVTAKLITITEHVSACSAVYTLGSRSVTVVQSTITVTPTPWTDKGANSGTPFVLEVGQVTSGHSKKRQARSPVWVTPDGRTTTVGASAAQYVIKNGMLSTVNGGYISTNDGVSSQVFAVWANLQQVGTKFAVEEGFLNWTNAEFSGGVAQLFQMPATQTDNAEVMARFAGPILPSWSPIVVAARPVSEATQGGSSGPMPSVSVSTAINVGSMSPGPPMSSAGGQGGHQSAGPSTSHAGQSSPSQVGQPSSSPSATGNISPDGICGASTGYTCIGSEGGECCSQYGYCGSGDIYCGAGCQPAFGVCAPVGPASMSSPQSASPKAPTSNPGTTAQSSARGGSGGVTIATHSMIMSMSASQASMVASSPSPMPSFVCPDDDGKTVADLSGVRYTLGCGRDTTVGAFASVPVTDSFDECFALCDAEAHCTAFTYSGGSNGVGDGICYFKNQRSEFVNHGPNIVGAIRLSPPAGASSSTAIPTSTFTSPAGPIGPNHPGGNPTGSSPMSMNMSGTYFPPSPHPTTSSSNTIGTLVASSTPASASGMPSSSPASVTSSSSMNMPGMSATSSSGSPSSTIPVSPNGHCGTDDNGGTPQGYTCSGSGFGICCSSSGYCGNSTYYCLGGCQPDFGSCTEQGNQPVTSMGECGVNSGNQTCTGGIFGACCSTSGYCGSDEQYCSPGMCDPMFGICDGASSSTMQMSSTSVSSSMSSTVSSSAMSTPSSMMMSSPVSPPSSSSAAAMMTSSSSSPSSSPSTVASSSSSSSAAAMITSTSSTRPTATSSSSGMTSSTSSSSIASSTTGVTSPTPTPSNAPSDYNPICPSANGTGFTDTAGNQYVILCDRNTDPGAFASSSEPDFASCIDACNDQTGQACVGVTFVGGSCYFKNQYSGNSASSGTDAAILASVLGVTPATYTPPVSTSTAASTSSSSSSVVTSSLSSSSIMSSPSSNPTVTNMDFSSSTQSSSSTTSSASSTSTGPYLVLASPTPCDFGDPAGYDEDDSYCEISLPFTMQMYAQTDTNSYACTNGFISIQDGSSQYEAQQLPASNLPNNTVAPFFDDLYLYGNSDPQQGIFYQINADQTAITYEYYVGRAGQDGDPYHFTVLYDSARVGVFTFTYYSAGGSGDDGLYAAVGIQGVDSTGTEQGFTYSYQSQDIAPGLVVECDTQANTCTTTASPSKLRR